MTYGNTMLLGLLFIIVVKRISSHKWPYCMSCDDVCWHEAPLFILFLQHKIKWGSSLKVSRSQPIGVYESQLERMRSRWKMVWRTRQATRCRQIKVRKKDVIHCNAKFDEHEENLLVWSIIFIWTIKPVTVTIHLTLFQSKVSVSCRTPSFAVVWGMSHGFVSVTHLLARNVRDENGIESHLVRSLRHA